MFGLCEKQPAQAEHAGDMGQYGDQRCDMTKPGRNQRDRHAKRQNQPEGAQLQRMAAADNINKFP